MYQYSIPCRFRAIAQTLFSNSRSLYDTAHLYPSNPWPDQVSTSDTLRFHRYSPDKIFKVRVTTEMSKVKSRSHHDCYTPTPHLCSYPVSTSYTLWFSRYIPDNIFKLKVTTARSNFKPRSHHDVAHLQP